MESELGQRRIIRTRRGPRVVGSFEHPILPMPPVSGTIFFSGGTGTDPRGSEKPQFPPWTSCHAMPSLSTKLMLVVAVS